MLSEVRPCPLCADGTVGFDCVCDSCGWCDEDRHMDQKREIKRIEREERRNMREGGGWV